MKKLLVLVTMLVFGLANQAFTANQFSTIPDKHWAYAAINQLRADGVIANTETGDAPITRYEAAQVVATAMSKNIDSPELKKLTKEFAKELESLGVRIKQRENAAVIGWEYLLQYRSVMTANNYMEPTRDDFILRTRLAINKSINKNWEAHIMLQNIQNMGSNSSGTSDESKISLLRAAATGKYDRLQVQLGRFAYYDKDALIFNVELNGIQLDYTLGKLKATASYGTFDAIPRYNPYSAIIVKENPTVTTLGFALDWQATKRFALTGGWYRHKVAPGATHEGLRVNIYDALATYKVGDWKLSAMYLGADKDAGWGDGRNGYGFRIGYGEFDFNKKGSYLLQVNYFKMPTYAYYGSPYFVEDLGSSFCGAKGINLVADYIVEKNFRIRTAYTNATDLSKYAHRTVVYTIYAQFYF